MTNNPGGNGVFSLKQLGWTDKVEATNTNYNVEMESVINEVERMVTGETD